MKQCLETHCGFREIFIFKIMKLKELLEKEECDLIDSNYVKTHRILTLLCKKHSIEFKQNASNLYKGNKSCPVCKKEKQISRIKEIKLTHSDFLKRCKNKINFFKYLSKYDGAEKPMIIKCLKHDFVYEQLPWVHLNGEGCPKCSNELRGLKRTKSHLNFVEKANILHNDSYEYPFQYEKRNKKLKIFCKNHGIFKQTPTNHLQNHGCPRCISIISKPEIQVQEFLQKMNYNIITNSRNIIKPYELDIYIPSLKKAIEFNGNYWHYSQKHFVPGKHAQKSNLCREKGIHLLHIREDLWLKDKEKMKQIILRFLQK